MTTLYHITVGRVLIGDNEGLYLLEITGDNLFKFGDRDVRKVSQIRVMKEDNLVALLAGKEIFSDCYEDILSSLSLSSLPLLPHQVPSDLPSGFFRQLLSSMER